MNTIALLSLDSVTGALFPLGRLCCTPGAKEMLSEAAGRTGRSFGMLVILLVARHQLGDWREMGEDDREANRQAAALGARVLSSFDVEGGQKLWIVTEADRSVTTLLLPDEY